MSGFIVLLPHGGWETSWMALVGVCLRVKKRGHGSEWTVINKTGSWFHWADCLRASKRDNSFITFFLPISFHSRWYSTISPVSQVPSDTYLWYTESRNGFHDWEFWFWTFGLPMILFFFSDFLITSLPRNFEFWSFHYRCNSPNDIILFCPPFFSHHLSNLFFPPPSISSDSWQMKWPQKIVQFVG